MDRFFSKSWLVKFARYWIMQKVKWWMVWWMDCWMQYKPMMQTLHINQPYPKKLISFRTTSYEAITRLWSFTFFCNLEQECVCLMHMHNVSITIINNLQGRLIFSRWNIGPWSVALWNLWVISLPQHTVALIDNHIKQVFFQHKQ